MNTSNFLNLNQSEGDSFFTKEESEWLLRSPTTFITNGTVMWLPSFPETSYTISNSLDDSFLSIIEDYNQQENPADEVVIGLMLDSELDPSSPKFLGERVHAFEAHRPPYSQSTAPIVTVSSEPLPPVVKSRRVSRRRGRRAARDGNPKRKHVCHIEGCEEPFGRKEHLRRHLLTVHGLGEMFTCPGCHKSYTRQDNLKKHMKESCKC
jgi:uncharacterized Zn-finger protein